MNAIKTDRLAEIENFSGTDIAVAEFQGEEYSEVYSLYRDSAVNRFVREDTRKAAESVVALPPLGDRVKNRNQYFDEMLEEQILSGFRQVVILGAGLDTRAVRKPSASVTYFEIDDAATLRLKQTRYEEQGIDINVRFIPGNYVTNDLIKLLNEEGFNFDLPTYIIWKGNTMYLPLETNKQIITQLRQHLKQFRLSFDYMADAVISKTTGDPGITRLVGCFTNMGAPWLSGGRDIQA